MERLQAIAPHLNPRGKGFGMLLGFQSEVHSKMASATSHALSLGLFDSHYCSACWKEEDSPLLEPFLVFFWVIVAVVVVLNHSKDPKADFRIL